MAEITKGIYKNWDIDAYSQKQVFSTSNKYFEVDRGRIGIKNILQRLETELMTEIIGINTFADPSKETESGSDKKWDNRDAMRKSESTNGWNKTFANDWADILVGPLIHPEDLAALAARIKTFTEIAEEVEQ